MYWTAVRVLNPKMCLKLGSHTHSNSLTGAIRCFAVAKKGGALKTKKGKGQREENQDETEAIKKFLEYSEESKR